MKHCILLIALGVGVSGLSVTHAQDSEFYKKPTTAPEYWRALTFEISIGKFEVAAVHLKGLIDIAPTDEQLLTIETKDGLTAFLRLRNVERWSRNKEVEKEARANVETLIGKVSLALKNQLTDPVRITKFAKNLSATPEEAAFALKELTRSGVDAIPILVELLRGNQPTAQRAAILDALPYFDIAVVPALIASLDAPEATIKLELLDSLRKRDDYLSFSSRAETDLMPYLWYFSAPIDKNPEALRKKAKEMLIGLLDRDPAAERIVEFRQPQYRLTELSKTFLDHKARFGTPEQSSVWKWDGQKPVVTAMPIADAEEYFGLRYARWALEIQDDYAAAQKAFLTLALEKHFARAGTDQPLVKSSPALYGVLVTAPYPLLSELTEQYMQENRVPLAVAVLQAIGDRAETKAARPSDPKAQGNEFSPSLLLKAMDYPNQRVRFAAVDALLKAPGSPVHQRTSAIVKILAGVLQGDDPVGEGKPRALIGDSDRVRSEMFARIVRKAGFNVEVVRTGRDLMRRLQTNANVELVIIDHHLPYPVFADTLAQLRADFRTRGLPVLVVASPDEPTTAHPITLMGRLAALAAAEEHIDFIRRQATLEDSRRESPAYRFKYRADILRAKLDSAGIRVGPDVEDRIEYLINLTTPVGDFPASVGIVETRLILNQADRLNRMEALRSNPKKGRILADEPPFSNTKELTNPLANVVARYEIALTAEVAELAEIYWKIMQNGQNDPNGKVLQPPLPGVAIRHAEVEARARLLSRGFKRVKVIPEVFVEPAFKEELQGFFAVQDPKQVETDRKADARAAMEWLRKMAVGELTGYPVIDAEATLRQALQNPAIASMAIEAVVRLPGKDAQQDIASMILGTLEAPVRAQAVDALIRHVQQRGLMVSDAQKTLLLDRVTTEADAGVRTRLLALRGILQPNSRETGGRLRDFVPGAEPKEKIEEPKEKKEEPKNLTRDR